MSDIKERGYAQPEVLVSTDWVAQHLSDPKVRIIESNEDPLLYPARHLAGAVEVDWTKDLNDQLRRDYLGKAGFEALMSRIGCTRDTTVVFYGDKNNWWACYALWVFHLFGHTATKVMDGGSLKWEKEGRPMTKEVPKYPSTQYVAPERDDSRILLGPAGEDIGVELLHMGGAAVAHAVSDEAGHLSVATAGLEKGSYLMRVTRRPEKAPTRPTLRFVSPIRFR